MTPPAEPEVDQRLLHALGDPMRHEVLLAIAETPDSVAGVSGRLDLPLEEVRGHVRELVASDAVEQIDGDDVRADDRRYRSMIRPFLDDAHWRELPAEQRQALFALTLRRLSERIDDGLASGGFGHVQTHVSFTRLLLDEQGWQEMSDLLAGVLEEAMQIEADAAERRRASGDEAFYTNLAVMHFGRADAGARATPEDQEA
jgi:DNA-binding transcriptional ArsR family regulator